MILFSPPLKFQVVVLIINFSNLWAQRIILKPRKNLEKKKHEGKDVEPVYYHGVHAGHGKYMAAKYAGTAISFKCNWQAIAMGRA